MLLYIMLYIVLAYLMLYIVLAYLIIIIIIIIIIIMVIFKCYFSGELITLSYKKNNKKIKNNSGVNIELGKTNRLKALCFMEKK